MNSSFNLNIFSSSSVNKSNAAHCHELPGYALSDLECQSTSTSTLTHPSPLAENYNLTVCLEKSDLEYQSSSTSTSTHPDPLEEDYKLTLCPSDPEELRMSWKKMQLFLEYCVEETIKKYKDQYHPISNPLKTEKVFSSSLNNSTRLRIHDFLKLSMESVNKYLSSFKKITDLKKLDGRLDKELSIRFYPYIETFPLKLKGYDGSDYIMEKKIWHDIFSEERRILGNDEIHKLHSFEKIFFNILKKEEDCKNNLLKFQLENNKIANYDLFGPCFLGKISSGFRLNTEATPMTLSFLHLVRLIVFRYIKIISFMMLIDKTVDSPLKWIEYKRLAIAKSCEFQVYKGIENISLGMALPDNFWKGTNYISKWILNYKKTENYKPVAYPFRPPSIRP